jgi:hypothetical protein
MDTQSQNGMVTVYDLKNMSGQTITDHNLVLFWDHKYLLRNRISNLEFWIQITDPDPMDIFHDFCGHCKTRLSNR